MNAPREWFEKDFYKVLGVSEKAEAKEITRAYRKLARENHPDANPDNAAAEFAVIVRTDVAGKGLGMVLMQHVLDHARRRGIGEVHGDILAENVNMLDLCRRLGFAIQRDGTIVSLVGPSSGRLKRVARGASAP